MPMKQFTFLFLRNENCMSFLKISLRDAIHKKIQLSIWNFAQWGLYCYSLRQFKPIFVLSSSLEQKIEKIEFH